MSSTFGGQLRAHRERAGLTQRHLADLTTLSERAIRDLECGRTRPRLATVRLLADGLTLRGERRTAFLASARETVLPPGLLGRDAELAVLAELLGDDGDRLVTITGVAGVGKTRLAMAAAARLPGPVLWCDAEPASPGGGLDPAAAAESLRDRPWGRLPRTSLGLPGLVQWCGTDTELAGTVLVLDAPEPTAAAGLLRQLPRVRLLCTARAPLGLPAERVVPLLPLAVPTGHDLAEVAGSPSARLLLRHIRALDPGFRLDRATVAAVAGICALVDGLPAALERAGDACALRPVHLVHRRLADGPGPDLSDTLSLLGAAERDLLTWLSGFAKPWAVDEVGADPAAIHTLLRHGLLRRSGPRFQVLGLVRPWHAQPVGA